MRLNLLWKWSLLVVTLALLVVAGIQWRNNSIHTVVSLQMGKVYRSGQLNPSELQSVISRLGIHSVINLRGQSLREKWYRDEVSLCHQLGIQHEDIRWSASHLPLPGEVEKLLQAYHTLSYPILIHCQAGADRTGLAGAIYLVDEQGFTPQNAANRSLSLTYGHLAIYPYFEMDELMGLYEKSGRKSFSAWVKNDYPRLYEEEKKESFWHELLEPLN